MVLVYDILGDFWCLFMTILVVVQNKLGHYISFRTFLVLVYDIFGDFWSSFIRTLVVIQNNLGHSISFRTFLVLVYDIMEIFCRRLLKYWWLSKIIYSTLSR